LAHGDPSDSNAGTVVSEANNSSHRVHIGALLTDLTDLTDNGTGLTSSFEPAFSTFSTSRAMLALYHDYSNDSGLTPSLAANTMTRMIQISPGVAFAAVVLSAEWSVIATGGLRPVPGQVNDSASAVDRTMTSVMDAAHAIEQLDLL
jgi:hypothetical protein